MRSRAACSDITGSDRPATGSVADAGPLRTAAVALAWSAPPSVGMRTVRTPSRKAAPLALTMPRDQARSTAWAGSSRLSRASSRSLNGSMPIGAVRTKAFTKMPGPCQRRTLSSRKAVLSAAQGGLLPRAAMIGVQALVASTVRVQSENRVMLNQREHRVTSWL